MSAITPKASAKADMVEPGGGANSYPEQQHVRFRRFGREAHVGRI